MEIDCRQFGRKWCDKQRQTVPIWLTGRQLEKDKNTTDTACYADIESDFENSANKLKKKQKKLSGDMDAEPDQSGKSSVKGHKRKRGTQ